MSTLSAAPATPKARPKFTDAEKKVKLAKRAALLSNHEAKVSLKKIVDKNPHLNASLLAHCHDLGYSEMDEQPGVLYTEF
jgi:hypothetical protein